MTATERRTADTPATRPAWWRGRGELLVAAGVLATSGALAWGTITMEIPPESGVPGPQFFPTIVSILLAVLAILLAISVVRTPNRPDPDEEPSELNQDMLADLGGIDSTTELRIVSGDPALASRAATPSGPARPDTKTMLVVAGAIAGFILLLQPVGWLLSAAALFWVVARALGSRRTLFDIGLALLFSALVQLAFSAGLGLALPAGILTGAFSWIS